MAKSGSFFEIVDCDLREVAWEPWDRGETLKSTFKSIEKNRVIVVTWPMRELSVPHGWWVWFGLGLVWILLELALIGVESFLDLSLGLLTVVLARGSLA